MADRRLGQVQVNRCSTDMTLGEECLEDHQQIQINPMDINSVHDAIEYQSLEFMFGLNHTATRC